MHVMYTRSFVFRDNFSCFQILDKEPIEDAAIPIRRNISDEHLQGQSTAPLSLARTHLGP